MLKEWLDGRHLGLYVARIKKRNGLEGHCALSLLLEVGSIERSAFFSSTACSGLVASFDHGWDAVVAFSVSR